ncbi:MAG: hypothetical protein JST84_10530 [Acidobacteria bacterium]|nr:hypothetical protein [Acidobacteriota bacterium]
MLLGLVFCGATPTQAQRYSTPLSAFDLAYSEATDRLYATESIDGGQMSGTTVKVINPSNGQILSSIEVGAGARYLAISDDGGSLYVSLDGPQVKRINLRTGQIDLTFPVLSGREDCAKGISYLRVMPGHPETVAVTTYCTLYGQQAGIAIFDNGKMRPQTVEPKLGTYFGVKRYAFGDTPDVLYGYNTDSDAFELYKFKITDQGITVEENLNTGLTYAFNTWVEFNNGLLYTSNGRAIDVTNKIINGRFYTTEVLFSSSIAFDPKGGSVYFPYRGGSDFALLEFDIKTYRLKGYYRDFAVMPDTPTRLIKCGNWGLAASNHHNPSIVFLPFSLLRPVVYDVPLPQPPSTQLRRIPLENNSIVYSPRHRLIYASTPGWGGDYGNSIVPLDPETGIVGAPVWVGSDPWQMTLSEQEEYLYVALYNSWSIRRLHLPDLTPDLRFSMHAPSSGPFGGISRPIRAADLLPVPGRADSIIVARAYTPGGGEGANPYNVAVYTNGNEQPLQTEPSSIFGLSSIISSMQFDRTKTAIYGIGYDFSYNDYDTPLYKLGLSGNGVSILNKDANLRVSGRVLRCENGYCFTETGMLVDPEARTTIGRFILPVQPRLLLSGYTGGVVPDVLRNRVYFLASDDARITISAYDISTFKQTGIFKIDRLIGDINNAFLWKDDQLVFSTPEEVVFLPLALLEPTLPPRARAAGLGRRSSQRKETPARSANP